MEKFARFIVNHKLLIGVIIIALIGLSVVGFLFVETNSDVQSYLPKDSMTIEGRDVLYEKFGILGTCTLAVKTEDKQFVGDLAGRISENKLVNQMVWAGLFDELGDIIESDPFYKLILGSNYAELLDKFVVSTDSGTIYLINLYLNKSSSDTAVTDYVDELDDMLSAAVKEGKISEYAMGGDSVNARDMLKSSIGEVPKYMVIAILLLTVILLITTQSWIEPFILLVTLGVSLLFNMGSNVIYGQISTVTYSASTILQLALAMDYSIFLMHCFYDERKRNPLSLPKDAMITALPKTLKSVAASALTTIGGFIALFVMEFTMGIDLGLVLAKGVALSLLTVIFLQPILILALSKPLEKTKHKYFTPRLNKTPKMATKRYKPIVILALILVVPSLVGQFSVPLSYLTMTKPSDSPTVTEQVIADTSNQLILVVPSDEDKDKYYDFIREVERINGIGDCFSVYSVIPEIAYDYAMTNFPELTEQLTGSLVSDGYTLMTFDITSGVEGKLTYDNIDRVMALSDKYFGDGRTYMTGLAQAAKDLAAVTPTDFIKVSLISALLIFVILLLTYRSWLLSAVLLLVIELGIWLNLSFVTLVGISINFMSYIIISSVQLGATVDYAILVASKYKQAKIDGVTDDVQAIIEGVKSASPSILISASVLIGVCVSVFAVTSNLIIGEISMLIAAGAFMSTVLVVTLLPAVLTLMSKIKEKRVNKKLRLAGVPADKEELEAQYRESENGQENS